MQSLAPCARVAYAPGMNHSLRFVTLALLALGALSACNKAKDAPAGAPASAPATASAENPATPVAKYGDKVITLKEVDAELTQEFKRFEKEKREARQQRAEQMAMRALVNEAAQKEGLAEKEWFAKHVDAQVPTPSEEEIKKVFEENKARMPPDATVASMREQIIGFLTQDQRRTQALKVFEELKAKSGYQLLLEEPKTLVEAVGPARGPAGAKVTIVEFSDFECPFCSRAETSVSEVMERYAGKVRLVFRHFPLPMHPNAPKAAEASACADEQGKFWEMHKQLFANQQKLTSPDLKAHAKAIGLDEAKFGECLDQGKMKAKVDADQQAGAEAGVTGTPAFFINGKLLSGAQPFSAFQAIIDQELSKG